MLKDVFKLLKGRVAHVMEKANYTKMFGTLTRVSWEVR